MSLQPIDVIARRLVEVDYGFTMIHFLKDHPNVAEETVSIVLAKLCTRGEPSYAIDIAKIHRASGKLTREESEVLVRSMCSRVKRDPDAVEGIEAENILEISKLLDLTPDAVTVMISLFTEMKYFDLAVQAAGLRPSKTLSPSELGSIANTLLGQGELDSAASFRPEGKLRPEDVFLVVKSLLGVDYSAHKIVRILTKYGSTREISNHVVRQWIEKEGPLWAAVEVASLGSSPEVVNDLVSALCRSGSHDLALRATTKLRPEKPLTQEELSVLTANMKGPVLYAEMNAT